MENEEPMAERFTLPVLPLRDTVVYPGVAVPISAGRPGTVEAVTVGALVLGWAVASGEAASARKCSLFGSDPFPPVPGPGAGAVEGCHRRS